MQDIVIPSFYAQYGFKNKLCATDAVYACDAALESVVIFYLIFYFVVMLFVM